MRAVEVAVGSGKDVALVVVEVVPVHVVHEAVAVVVEAVARGLAGVGPHIGGEIGVAVVNPFVDHAHDHRAGACRDVPRRGRIDVGTGRAVRLAGVVEPVEVAVERVVRREARVDLVIGMGPCDARHGGEERRDVGRRGERRPHVHEQLTREAEPTDDRHARHGGLEVPGRIGHCPRVNNGRFGQPDDPGQAAGGNGPLQARPSGDWRLARP